MPAAVRYLETRRRKGGRPYYVVNPPKYVRQVTGASFQTFEDYKQAVLAAQAVYSTYVNTKKGKKPAYVDQSTVAGLIQAYRNSTAFKKLRKGSQTNYASVFRLVENLKVNNTEFGSLQAKSITPKDADRLYQHIEKSVSATRGHAVCKILRRVWFVGKRHGLVDINPFERMGISAPKSRTVLWEPEEIDRFVAKADEMGLQSLGTLAILMYDLCQRPGDMRMLKWSDYNESEGTISFIQEKTGTEMYLPVSPRIKNRLKMTPQTSEFIVLGPYGKPLCLYSVSRLCRKVLEAAGLPKHLQMRDFRRTGATELAEAGATEDELRSVTGHQSRDVLSIYVRPTKKLAITAMNRRFQK